MDSLSEMLRTVRKFEKEAHTILGRHEASLSRVVVLEESYRRLSRLSLKQDDLFRQSLRCVEHELYCAAHVMGWAAFVDFLEGELALDGFVRLNATRPNWSVSSIEDLREYPEHQIIEAARDAKLLSKGLAKTLIGLLSRRNECAHPTDYSPGMNEALGYISELLGRVREIANKHP